jgi:hypothetical protein
MSSCEDMEIALHLIRSGGTMGCTLRLFGGMGFYYHRHNTVLPPSLNRTPGDIDFACYSDERGRVEELLWKEGFCPDRGFNAVQAPLRAKYHDGHIRIDVIFDEFVMCHRIDLRPRLKLAPVTLPLGELIMTKLQIVRWTEKDMQDVLTLLVGHPVVANGADHAEEIDSSRLAELVGRNWGLYHTTLRSLEYIRSAFPHFIADDGERRLIALRLADIEHAVRLCPKSLGWRLRAVVGERLPWYEAPE